MYHCTHEIDKNVYLTNVYESTVYLYHYHYCFIRQHDTINMPKKINLKISNPNFPTGKYNKKKYCDYRNEVEYITISCVILTIYELMCNVSLTVHLWYSITSVMVTWFSIRSYNLHFDRIYHCLYFDIFTVCEFTFRLILSSLIWISTDSLSLYLDLSYFYMILRFELR